MRFYLLKVCEHVFESNCLLSFQKRCHHINCPTVEVFPHTCLSCVQLKQPLWFDYRTKILRVFFRISWNRHTENPGAAGKYCCQDYLLHINSEAPQLGWEVHHFP